MKNYLDYLNKNFVEHITEKNTKLYTETETEKALEVLELLTDNIKLYDGLSDDEYAGVKQIIENLKHNSGIATFKLPKWYEDFLKETNGVRYLSLLIAGNGWKHYKEVPIRIDILNLTKPAFIDDDAFVVGRYIYEDTPIYATQEGKIFVHQSFNIEISLKYDKKEISKKDLLGLGSTKTPLLAEWPNIETFLIEETQRLNKLNKEMSIWNPIPKETLPNNTGAKLINLSDLLNS